MGVFWQRSGDPLGDFVRLNYLLEEALERLGAPQDGTLGEKLSAVGGYLRVQDPGLWEQLWEWVHLRNHVLHRRLAVGEEALDWGLKLVARLLGLVQSQSYYTWKELDEKLQSVRTFPPVPSLIQVPIRPEQTKTAELHPGPRVLEVPRRSFDLRPLHIPRRPVLVRAKPFRLR